MRRNFKYIDWVYCFIRGSEKLCHITSATAKEHEQEKSGSLLIFEKDSRTDRKFKFL